MTMFNPSLIKNLEKLLEKDPSSKSFCSLAEIYRQTGKLDKAEGLCLAGLLYHPSYSQAHVILGQIFIDKKDFEKALEHLNMAKELNPDNPAIYRKLAEIYTEKKDMEQTLQAYKMLILLKPNDKTAAKIIDHLQKILGDTLVVSTENTHKIIYKKHQRSLDKLNKILKKIELRIK